MGYLTAIRSGVDCACGCGEQTFLARKTYSCDGVRRGQPRRFLNGHHNKAWVPAGATHREEFDARWIPEPNTGCWLWMGTVAPRRGYGRINIGNSTIRFAHRVGWELYRQPVPPGMVLDHVCRVRSCVNPDHLRVVTVAQNVLENSMGLAARNRTKTHCHRGHAFTTENTYVPPGKRSRDCRACASIRAAIYCSKGSQRRPPAVPAATVAENWLKTFGPKPTKDKAT